MIQMIKDVIGKMLDYTVVKLVKYVYLRVASSAVLPGTDVTVELSRMAVLESAEYARANMSRALVLCNREAVWSHALGFCGDQGLITEFGVWKGCSINFIAKALSGRTVYGFDSFEGLREDWAGHMVVKGTFDLKGKLPKVRGNVQLVKGTFDKTLPGFFGTHSESIALMHVDSDTYEAAKIVFHHVNHRIVSGTIIMFDEYFGFHGWKLGEFKAFQEFVAENRIKYEYLGFSISNVSLRILGRG